MNNVVGHAIEKTVNNEYIVYPIDTNGEHIKGLGCFKTDNFKKAVIFVKMVGLAFENEVKTG